MPSSDTEGPAVEFRGVAKRYGATPAVRDLSFSVGRGEFFSLLGPSGCGKTTTLRLLAGFESADEGEIRLLGARVNERRPYERQLAMVFQNYALFPHLTVKANVAFPLEMRNVARADMDRRVAEALAMVELAGYEARLPRQLSGGQQQRVALARAIVFNPRLLLLDEPFGALDRKLRETMQLEVRRLQRRLGLTTIFITHDQEEALVLSDRIAVMNKGAIQQVATTTEIYEHPANDFVADFVGESNIFHGTVSTPGTVALDDGGSVKVASDKPAGAKVGVLMRPERFGATGTNLFAGEVIESVYLGTSFKLRLAIEGGRELLVRQPARGALPAAGSRVTVGIEPDAIHVF